MKKAGRNDPCSCGSGKKFKHCCIGQASASSTTVHIDRVIGIAIGHHQSGRLKEAERGYREVLALKPNHPDALHLLGLIAHRAGRYESAVELIERAIAVQPSSPVPFNNLGTVLQDQGKWDAALARYRQALALDPNYAEAYCNLANTLGAQGRTEDAIAHYRQALALRPEFAQAHYNLANALKKMGDVDQALASYRRALEIAPALAMAHFDLGLTLEQLGRLAEAVSHYRLALEHDPDLSEAHCNLGLAFQHQGKLDDAIACFRRALECKPDSAVAYSNLALPLQQQGRLDEALAAYRQALAIKPDFAEAYSNLLLTLQYVPRCSPAEKFAEHLRFAERFEAPLKPLWRAHRNAPEPLRRLRLGYVSGDLRDHAVAYFVEPILANHDKASFEVFCYANHAVHDGFSARIAATADHWVPCRDLSDEHLAQRIRADGIDILIDLAGHTAHNRLLTFARKPAPVQMSWIGYPATTGLAAMDYRLTEESLDPRGMTEQYHTETLLRLPSGAAFRPASASPPINALPALSSTQFTLASLNNPVKINPAVVQLWARILNALPHANMVLGAAMDPSMRQRFIDMFAHEGIAAERLIVFPRMPIGDYLALHHHIDLALDPFPYNGGTTTCHSLWMGVPVVTLAGNDSASRYGVALMQGLGLTEFVASAPDEYAQRVVALAADLPHLNRIRQSLRERIAANLDRDPLRLTRQLEAAYRTAWRKWCDGRGGQGSA